MTQVSGDGFWQFENGQWVPTQMQLEALSNGAKPYVEEMEIPIQNQPIHLTQATDDDQIKTQITKATRFQTINTRIISKITLHQFRIIKPSTINTRIILLIMTTRILILDLCLPLR